ncbi:HD-domain/PDEase-like protein [Thelephora ganbajun]|uniref:HD-domain/PDEase-like protein n=1 Tax=Thelephora ganbajun TaxID=370292 RepID=A0ACB6ZMP6_THEGA|nr:HD-domain/PDEase-like protein [Thelephora ganbajun]
MRMFKDSIHGYMPFSPKICAFIDTAHFQRLRFVKQLGTSYRVWPGAAHNRFEHCLGVAYLARCMAEHLKDQQPELGITDRDVECVQVAGLCHDLGHGPFSHVWDGQFIPAALPGKYWKHEDASEMMFDDLVVKNNIDLPENDIQFIKALIAGDPSSCSDNTEKPFLFEIVANRRNGIDVDKFDYIARDTKVTSDIASSICTDRLINCARVIEDQICYDIKDANMLFELCHTRYSLHKLIYSHKTARAIEYMIVDALLAAESVMHFAGYVTDPGRYLHLTDSIIELIQMSNDQNLTEAQAILNRITSRDLYKTVDYKVFTWDWKGHLRKFFNPEAIVSAARLHKPENDEERVALEELSNHHVIIDEVVLHYGMGNGNPVDSIRFYSKRKPQECSKAEPGDISSLMPATFGEVLLRIYTRDIRFFGLIQHGYRLILQGLPSSPEEELPTSGSDQPSTPTRFGAASPVRSSSGRVFSNNSFTTVKPGYVPPSPTAEHVKRKWEDGVLSPCKKLRSE